LPSLRRLSPTCWSRRPRELCAAEPIRGPLKQVTVAVRWAPPSSQIALSGAGSDPRPHFFAYPAPAKTLGKGPPPPRLSAFPPRLASALFPRNYALRPRSRRSRNSPKSAVFRPFRPITFQCDPLCKITQVNALAERAAGQVWHALALAPLDSPGRRSRPTRQFR
jgi:hypothetical protein